MNTSRVDKCGKIGCSLSKSLALLHLSLSSTSTLTASTAALTSIPFTFTLILTFSSKFSALTSASMFSLPDFTTTHFVTSGPLTTKRSFSFVPRFFLRGSASLVLFVPLVSALSVSTPVGLTSGGPAVIAWSVAQGDPQTFSIELINDVVAANQFALANNVPSSAGSLNLVLPKVPFGGSYVLQLVNNSNITDVFAQSGEFTIGLAQSTATSSTTSATSATFSFLTASGSSTNTLIPSNATQTTAPSSFHSAGTVGTSASVPTAPGIGNTNNQSTASGSRAKVAGIVVGVVGAIIICLAILPCIRRGKIPWSSMIRRGRRKKNAEVPGLPIVREVENNVVPLHWPLESGRRNWTDHTGESVHQAGLVSHQHPTETVNNRTKHPAPISNNVSENSQITVEPISSVMQEVDSLRARIAELERQQQGSRQNLHPPSVHSGTDDNRSAPPAYSDDGRY